MQLAANLVGAAMLSLMMGLLAGCSGLAVSVLPHPGGQLATRSAPARVAELQPAPPMAPSSMDGMIAKYSALYNVPEALIRRVIVRESRYNPKARNGPYYGLMQIRYDTAMGMGYRGPASGLLDADTNLRYGVKYLSGAYLVGGHNSDQAVRNYSRGYYYEAKRKGLLEEAGLK